MRGIRNFIKGFETGRWLRSKNIASAVIKNKPLMYQLGLHIGLNPVFYGILATDAIAGGIGGYYLYKMLSSPMSDYILEHGYDNYIDIETLANKYEQNRAPLIPASKEYSIPYIEYQKIPLKDSNTDIYLFALLSLLGGYYLWNNFHK